MRIPTVLRLCFGVIITISCSLDDASAQVFKRFCPPVCPPQEYCPPGSEIGGNQVVDPNQYLQPNDGQGQIDPDPMSQTQPTAPQVDPNLNVPQADTNLFASNPGAGEAGGIGQRGFIAGNQFISGATISGGSFGNAGAAQGFTVPIASGDRRVKLSDQFSPFPATRIFYNYHLFGNAARDIDGNTVDINRSTFGFERAFLNQNASIEMRIPIQSGVSKDQFIGSAPGVGQRGTQLGNIAISTKLLLSRTEFQSFAVGVATNLPTAPNGEAFFFGDADPIIRFNNETISVIPFFAINLNPNPQSWITFYTQADFSLNGDRVTSFVSFDPLFPTVSQKYNHQNLLSFDISLGRWLYQNPNASFLRGFATFFELHYTSTLNDTDSVIAGLESAGDVLTNSANRVDILDTTVGIRAQLGARTYLTAAYVAPLRSGVEKSFESEFNMNISRYFGGRN